MLGSLTRSMGTNYLHTAKIGMKLFENLTYIYQETNSRNPK